MARVIDGLFVALRQRDLRSAAYRDLSANARCSIVELDLWYWENGRINPLVLTQRWLASHMNVNPKTATRILAELETHWFLELERIGKMTGPNGQRGSLYRMTWLPSNDGVPASFASRGWMPPIPASGAPEKGASTGQMRRMDGAAKGGGRTSFRHAGLTARQLLQQVQTQRAQGETADSARRPASDRNTYKSK